MDARRTLNSRVYDAKAKIGKLKDLLQTHPSNEWELFEKLSDEERELNTAAALLRIFSVDSTNCLIEHLDGYTRTTPLMDRYAKSDKEFLLFSRAFLLGNRFKHVSLVVKKARGHVNYLNTGLVMTDLKKKTGTHISADMLQFYQKSSRFYPLFSELVKLGNLPLNKGDVIPFAHPCRLGGQTYSDQTGFGWEYCGDVVVHEGKQYGETTTFLIIGIIVED